MMRFGVVVAAVVVLSAPMSAWAGDIKAEWKAFLNAPDTAHFAPLYADIKSCTSAECIASAEIEEQDIYALADMVSAKKELAIRISFVCRKITRYHVAGSEFLAQSYGPVIREAPAVFLRLAKAEGVEDFSIVFVTGEALVDNDEGQKAELRTRMKALASVTEPDLIPLRDRLVAQLAMESKP